MSATVKLKMQERCVLGEVDTYMLTWEVVDTTGGIDPKIFIMEYTKSNPRLNTYNSEFHHVAYMPELSSVGTELTNKAHQYIRQSSITRVYPTIERMEESKKVMLQDISSLLNTFNQLTEGCRESEIVVTAEGYNVNTKDWDNITLDGDNIIIG